MRVPQIIKAGALALAGITAALAQTPPGAGVPGHITTPFSPQALPGDIIDLPQKEQLQVPLGPPAGTHSTRTPRVDNTLSPGYELALEAARAGIASCLVDGYAVGVVVTDAAGKIKVALEADNGGLNSIFMAARKDLTVVNFKMSTLELREKIASDPALMDKVTPNMSLLPGGLPILKGDTLVGAIAASGASAHEEEKCAQAGIDTIRARLP